MDRQAKNIMLPAPSIEWTEAKKLKSCFDTSFATKKISLLV